MIVSFTGHRPDKLGGYGADNFVRTRVVEALRLTLIKLKEEDPSISAISGMALGFDQWAAGLCIDLGIPFTAAVPFAGHEKMWGAAGKEWYASLLQKAERVVVVSDGGYAAWKMQRRNVWMVDNGDLLIAAWDGSDGGTANCVHYTEDQGKVIRRLSW